MVIQQIVDIAEICSRHGINQAVICPGSRSAPLTLAFARHPKIKTFVIPDERAAGFIALGLAQSSQNPVAIICTSGTAVASIYPSVIEAFYQQVPLLILTADRPPELIDQQDGQAIRQQNIFGNHILGSFQLPVSFDDDEAKWHANRIVNEGILKTTGEASGPVHINVPLREPFYPSETENFNYSSELRIIDKPPVDKTMSKIQWESLIKEIQQYQKIMVVVGQGHWSEALLKTLSKIQEVTNWVVIGDIIGNIHALEEVVTMHDVVLMKHAKQEALFPDLLITFGQSVLSKSLKTFLRNASPTHWHIGAEPEIVDTFKSITKKIQVNPESFFTELAQHNYPANQRQTHLFEDWINLDHAAAIELSTFLSNVEEGEFGAVKMIMQYLPEVSTLHLANSMPVRYANYVGLKNKPDIQVWANRGSSGIDGCTSTAIGHVLNSEIINVLISGDLAFFYDRNALWHGYVPDNFRIIILNNHGGGIFRLIDGPNKLDELETYFETKQNLTAENTARDFGMKYFSTTTLSVLPEILVEFFDAKTGKAILEIETSSAVNQKVFETFKDQFRK